MITEGKVNQQLRRAESEIRESAAHSAREIAAEHRYDQLQVEWDKALRDLKSATDHFSQTIDDVPVRAVRA